MQKQILGFQSSPVISILAYQMRRVCEPDPRKNRKEGLGDRLARKCTVCPECRRTSDWFMTVSKLQTTSIVQGD